jgi:plastocyanin
VLAALIAGLFLALAWGPLTGAGPAAAQAGPTLHINMKDFAFMPSAPPPIKVGTTVTWTYDESATDPMPNCETPGVSLACPGHTATAMDKGADGKALFDSGTLKKAGASFSFTFTKPGSFKYYCVYHGGTTQTGKNNPVTNMDGTIVVQGEAATAAAAPAPAAPAAATPAPSAAPAAHVQAASATASTSGSGGLANTGGPALFGWALLPVAAGLAMKVRRR